MVRPDGTKISMEIGADSGERDDSVDSETSDFGKFLAGFLSLCFAFMMGYLACLMKSQLN